MSLIAIWLILIKAVRWAVFPYRSKIITSAHHKDLNQRLVQEMVRLFKGVTKLIRGHMQYEEGYVHSMPDMSSLLDQSDISNTQ